MSGVYFYTLKAGDFSAMKKMLTTEMGFYKDSHKGAYHFLTTVVGVAQNLALFSLRNHYISNTLLYP